MKRSLAVLLILCGLGCSPVVAASGATVTYIYTDGQGSPVAEADGAGNITATYDYTPYGSTLLGTQQNGPGYTGHVADPDTSLTYMQARYYDSSMGQFLSVDPLTTPAGRVASFGTYAYAENNPTTRLDPDGKATCADKACKTSTIDARPGGPNGPTITFENDDPNGASPNQPVSTETAKMVEAAVIASGVTSVNINSTTGGRHASTSRHPGGQAVDINKVNGQSVRTQGDSKEVQDLQKAFEGQSNSRENFGPHVMEKTNKTGGKPEPFTDPKQAEDHENHIHESGQS